MNLNDLWVPNDPVDEWAAWTEYDMRMRRWQREEPAIEAARQWAESREAWLRQQAWLREKMRRVSETIRVAINPALLKLARTFTEAAESFRKAMATISEVATADPER